MPAVNASPGEKSRLPGAAALMVWIFTLAVWRTSIDGETDAFWTAREGIDVLNGGGLIHPDRFGWAQPDAVFVPNSPLWQLYLGIAFELGSLSGLLAASVLSLTSSLAAIAWSARKLSAGHLEIAVVLGLLVIGAAPLFVNRAALPAVALLLSAVQVASQQPQGAGSRLAPVRAFAIAWLLSALGIWLHNSWALYGLILAISGLAASFARALRGEAPRWRASWSWLVGAVLGILSGPLGAQVFLQTTRVGSVARGVILEWSTPWQLGAFWTGVWLTALIVQAAASRSVWRAFWAGDARPALLWTFGLFGLVAGASAIRFTFLALVALAPIAASQLTHLTAGPRARSLRRRLGQRGTRRYWNTVLALVAAALLIPVVRLAGSAYPDLRDPAVRAIPTGCRVFSDPKSAGAIILLRPDAKVWVDGRTDYWGRERLLLAIQYLRVQGPTLVPAGTRCVLKLGTERRSEFRRLADSLIARGWMRLGLPGEESVLLLHPEVAQESGSSAASA